jgi:hypothetical protein
MSETFEQFRDFSAERAVSARVWPATRPDETERWYAQAYDDGGRATESALLLPAEVRTEARALSYALYVFDVTVARSADNRAERPSCTCGVGAFVPPF